jgi:LacI family transcriptional regulator
LPKPPTRLKDIAEATGYSANTVSLALRGSPRIPQETRDRIRSAARKLNYLPNTIAQALVSRETKTIGLVLTDIMNPTLTFVAQCIERDLSKRGYSMMLAASDNDPAKEVSALEVFRSRQVDGILIYPTNHEEIDHIRAVRDAGYPVLVLNTEKHDGAMRALAEAGLPADSLIIVDPKGHTATNGYHAISKAMKEKSPPTAMFATTDSLAIGALHWCRENGVDVPGDLAIVGYDNTEAAEFAPVPMTSINYAADDVSRHAVDRLLSLMGQATLPAPLVTLIDPEIVVRKST